MDRVKLGDVAHIQTGPFGSQLHKSDYRQNGIPVIMPQNIGDRTLILEGIACVSEEDANRLSRHKTQPNDIVYARRGDVEKHAFIDNDTAGSLCGTGCLLVRPDTGKVNPTFLSFLLNHQKSRSWVSRHAVGSNMPNINTDILSGLPLELPGRPLQDATASILSTIDNKIANNKKLMTELEETARLIYDYWFTQFDFPDENGNPYRSSGGAMVYNETLHREIPVDWEVGTSGNLIEGIRTGLNPRQNFVLTDEGVAYLTVKNLTTEGTINFTSCDFISDDARKIVHRRSDVSKGDVLFASIAPLGRCYLVQEDPVIWDINESVFSVRPNYSCMSSEYLYLFLMGQYFIQAAEASSAGSVFKGIRNEELRSLDCIVPPKSIVDSFTNVVRPMLVEKHGILKESNELVALRDWLLPMLMSGQVSVGSQI